MGIRTELIIHHKKENRNVFFELPEEKLLFGKVLKKSEKLPKKSGKNLDILKIIW